MKKRTSIDLNDDIRSLLERIARSLGIKSITEAVRFAVRHTSSTLDSMQWRHEK